ncbi:unnamed protein product [Dovyalis caffra]|uniref:Uncharacterized protein n=1 Tax=Dovyalis caffra TaxID=77055 RepID=A0AAV1QYC7_9ROSI|nr:unnamed protein product [Dovyalis caffra]
MSEIENAIVITITNERQKSRNRKFPGQVETATDAKKNILRPVFEHYINVDLSHLVKAILPSKIGPILGDLYFPLYEEQ